MTNAASWNTLPRDGAALHPNRLLAEDLERGERDLDEGEDVEFVRWRVEEIESRLDELEDMKTIAALLLYLRER